MNDPNTTIASLRDRCRQRCGQIDRSFRDSATDVQSALNQRSDAVDQWLRDTWFATTDQPIQLIALGGFGRREMFPHSDIDFAIHTERPDALVREIETFLNACRDAKFKVAHAVRTQSQFDAELANDPRTAASYLDARVVFGPDHDFRNHTVAHLQADRDAVPFVEWLVQGFKQRRDRRGQSVYLLEPDIKDGHGGLRDLQAIRWASQTRFRFDALHAVDPEVMWTTQHREHLSRCYDYLCRVRYEVHLNNKRKNDRLRFKDQQQLAGSQRREDIEAWMRGFYHNVRDVRKLTERALRTWSTFQPARAQHGSGRYVRDGVLYATDISDDDVFTVLTEAVTHNALLSPGVESQIEEVVETWPKPALERTAQFRSLLFDPATSWRTSERLHELRILTTFIPEFTPVVSHVHHDVYHTYTTDAHLIRCLEFARGLVNKSRVTSWPFIHQVVDELEDPAVLLLTALTHDIGKNRGGNHSARGADLIRAIAPRLGFSAAQTELAAFLIREHLTLSHTARRLDIHDPRVVRKLATTIKTVETLNQLTALTFCDISTVRPDAMTDWTATLLMQLHARIRDTILHGDESVWKQMESRLLEKRNGVANDVGASHDAVDAFLRVLPMTHVADRPVEQLAREYRVFELATTSGVFEISTFDRHDFATTEMVVSGPDKKGTLSNITGVLSALGVNIFNAEITTTATGHIVDVFQIGAKTGVDLFGPVRSKRLAKVLAALDDVLNRGAKVEALLAKRRSLSRQSDDSYPPVETSVSYSNELSDTFTVIEVRAADRIGLLFEIADTMSQHAVNIVSSKIDSEGRAIIDTFYVESESGTKLSAEFAVRACDAIRDRLSA